MEIFVKRSILFFENDVLTLLLVFIGTIFDMPISPLFYKPFKSAPLGIAVNKFILKSGILYEEDRIFPEILFLKLRQSVLYMNSEASNIIISSPSLKRLTVET